MFNNRKLKLTACALAAVMGMGLAGPAITAAEASSHHPPKPRYEKHEPPREHHQEKHETKKTHSQGDVNTAAILGAIAGAVIAKNT